MTLSSAAGGGNAQQADYDRNDQQAKGHGDAQVKRGKRTIQMEKAPTAAQCQYGSGHCRKDAAGGTEFSTQ